MKLNVLEGDTEAHVANYHQCGTCNLSDAFSTAECVSWDRDKGLVKLGSIDPRIGGK
jgi:hypothetical protein